MNLGQAISTCFSKYVDFSGRATRSEYWYFFLFTFIVQFPIYILSIASDFFSLVYLLVILAFFLPSLAVNVRRLHDTNRSGWWLLISFVPCAGFIVLLIFLVQETTPGKNQYGK